MRLTLTGQRAREDTDDGYSGEANESFYLLQYPPANRWYSSSLATTREPPDSSPVGLIATNNSLGEFIFPAV